MIHKLVAYPLCIPLLPNKPNNKEHDEERKEYCDDTERREPSGTSTLLRVNSGPYNPFLWHQIVVRFYVDVGLLNNSLIFS